MKPFKIGDRVVSRMGEKGSVIDFVTIDSHLGDLSVRVLFDGYVIISTLSPEYLSLIQPDTPRNILDALEQIGEGFVKLLKLTGDEIPSLEFLSGLPSLKDRKNTLDHLKGAYGERNHQRRQMQTAFYTSMSNRRAAVDRRADRNFGIESREEKGSPDV